MLSNLLVVAAQVGTLFLMMAVGFTLAKLNRLTKEAVPQLSFLLLYVVVPCVVVDALQTERNPELLRELGLTAMVVSASYVAYALLSCPFSAAGRKQPGQPFNLEPSMGIPGLWDFRWCGLYWEKRRSFMPLWPS